MFPALKCFVIDEADVFFNDKRNLEQLKAALAKL